MSSRARYVTQGIRQEVQALRAISVIMVMFFHLWPGRFPGGFIAVDVFFVISGFLITFHLIREVETHNKVRLATFWARRARRLLPASFLVLIACAIAVMTLLPQVTWVASFRQIMASALYVQNWVLAIDSVDYLAADNDPTVVQHYWTLSTEEQFYLVWPLVVALAGYFAVRHGKHFLRALWIILGLTTAAAFTFSLWISFDNPAAAYFVTPARAWQFGSGALLAIYAAGRNGRPVIANKQIATLLFWAALAAFAIGPFIFGSETNYPGFAALLPVGATLAIIAAGMPGLRWGPDKIVALKPIQWVGDNSYSIYLWHWPPIVITPWLLNAEMGFWPRFALFFFPFIPAWLTKKYVEDPIRFGKKFGIRRHSVTFTFAALSAVVLVAVCVVPYQSASKAEARAAAVTEALELEMPDCFGAASMDPGNDCENPELDGLLVPAPVEVNRDVDENKHCWLSNSRSELATDCTFGNMDDESLPHIVLIGDSHARAFLGVFERLAELEQVRVTAHLKGTCAWTTKKLDHQDAKRVRTCEAYRANLFEWLDENQDSIDTVVTAAYGAALKGPLDDEVAGLEEAWQPMIAAGVPVVALRDNPDWDRDPNHCLAEYDPADLKADDCAQSRAEAFDFDDPLPVAAERLKGASVLDLTDFYCRADDVCPAFAGGVNMYRDKHHLTTTYTRSLAPFVYSRLINLEAIKPQA